jgi:hypothetical protein
LKLAPHHPDGIRLRKRYGGLIDNLFLFLEDAAIPATNNSSEQAIRMSVIFRHVTNGFRSGWGRDLFAAVRSVVNTGKRQGLTAYQSIQQALSLDGCLFSPSLAITKCDSRMNHNLEIQVQNLDRKGLVAGVIDERGIVEIINERDRR